MKLTPLTALIFLGCGNAASSSPTDDSAPIGSAAAAIRQLGQRDADAVKSCEDLAERCNELVADSGTGAVCDKIVEHCTDLAAQLSEARSQFEACLEEVATCEASAVDPADCATQRAACNPAGKDFEARRGATLECASRTQSCLPPGPRLGRGGRGADDDTSGDAGAASCDDDALDFVGCCHGHGGGFGGARPDGGVPGFGGFLGGNRGPGGAAGPGGPGRADDADDDDHQGPGHGGEAADAGGAERPDFGGGPGRR